MKQTNEGLRQYRPSLPILVLVTIAWAGWVCAVVGYDSTFHFPYAAPKWALVSVATTIIACGSLLLFLFDRRLRLARSWGAFAFFGAALCAWGAYRLQGLGLSFWNDFLGQRIGFGLLVLACSYLFFRLRREGIGPSRWLWPFAGLASFLVVLLSLSDLHYIYWVEDGKRWQFYFAPFTGHIGMQAEAIGFALLPVMWGAAKSQGSLRGVFVTVIILGWVCVWFTFARTAWLSHTAAVLLYAILSSHLRKPLTVAAGFAIPLVVAMTLFFPPRVYKLDVFAYKTSSKRDRIEILKESLPMVADSPLGIGVDQYQFAFLPYKIGGDFGPSEKVIEQSPHNEYLRVLIEDGWPGFLMILALVATVLNAARRCWQEEREAFGELAWVGLTAISIQSLFQFPFAIAHSFVWIALLLGMILSRAHDEPLQAVPAVSTARRFATAALIAAVLILYGRQAWRNYEADLVRTPADHACAIAPWNWRACVSKAELLIARGQPKLAQDELRPILKAQPYNFPAMRIWATAAFTQGDDAEGCKTLAKFDALFGGESSLHREYKSLCLR